MTSTTPASDHSESASAQPLLHAFDLSQRTDQITASRPLLQDGEDFGDEFAHLKPHRRRKGLWTWLQMSMRRRRNGEALSEDGLKSVNPSTGTEGETKSQRCRSRTRTLLRLSVVAMAVFGFIHIVNFFLGYVPLLWDDPASSSLDWTLPGQGNSNSDTASRLLDITRDVTPIPCHSHNDYWRRVPLYDALRWGCTGVEADVWLFDDELFVGHSTNALTPNRTFRSMYIDPLVQMLEHKNRHANFTTAAPSTKSGIFDTWPEQTLVLLVDFKNNGRDIFPIVSQHINPLREKGYLTHFNGSSTVPGPITVVATGNAPFNLISSNPTYRDIFFDAPLSQLSPSSSHHTSPPTPQTGQGTVGTTPDSHFDSSNSYYASVNFRKSIGFLWWGSLSNRQLDLLRTQIRDAHRRGLKARYWSTPKWPVALRNRVWNVLVSEGVDYLNGDDLQGMARLDWRVRRHWDLVG